MTELQYNDFKEAIRYGRTVDLVDLLGAERKNRTLLLANNTNNYTIHFYEEDSKLVLLQYEGKTLLKRSFDIAENNVVSEADLFYIVQTTADPSKLAQIRKAYPESCDYEFCLQLRKYFPKFFEQLDFAAWYGDAYKALLDNTFKGKIAVLETITVQALK